MLTTWAVSRMCVHHRADEAEAHGQGQGRNGDERQEKQGPIHVNASKSMVGGITRQESMKRRVWKAPPDQRNTSRGTGSA